MPKIYKVLIDEETYLGLKAESLLCNKTIKDTLSFMVSSNLSPDALNVLNVLKNKRTLIPNVREMRKSEDSESTDQSRSSPLEEKRPKGSRPWHGGPPPYEERHPEIAARVLAMWAGGSKKGGMSREAVAKALQADGIPMTSGTVSKITIRARQKNK
jgi:hypothetical protein